MAAPPAKPSPSNQAVQKTSDKVESTQPVTMNPVAVKTPHVSLTQAYENSESSDFYKLAKHLLAEGDFEQALTAVEKGIEVVKETQPESAMAPFHYLYGTTLLYHIEESSDTAMTVENQNAEETADDMQIAWENLEAARILVENLLSTSIADQKKMKFQLDLAQIALREGDLQRMNGRYSEAIQDYQTCIKFRKMHLGQYDRKIADAQYNLGLSYLSNSSELQKEELQKEDTSQTSELTIDRKKDGQEHCQKGVELYIGCAQTLCGQIALLCGVEPSDILEKMNHKQAGLKTTGLEEESSSSEKSQTLRDWRENVANLSPSVAEDLTVEDLRQLLDEIQETVDEAERSQDAVRQASQMKVQAQKAVDGEGEELGADGSTTTIGFGKPTLSGEVPPVATTAQAKPMMVIKKKKKKRDEDEDSKPAAVESKRAKTE
jgi:tetratricopeptide (TPR) repeat protein